MRFDKKSGAKVSKNVPFWEPIPTQADKIDAEAEYLDTWSSNAEWWNLSMKAGENRIDRREDGPTVPTGNEHLRDGGDDADIGLGLNTSQSLLKRDANVVDDLRFLHAGAGRDV